MDAGKLLGLTNCCGIAVGIAGNLITGSSALPCALHKCPSLKLPSSAHNVSRLELCPHH